MNYFAYGSNMNHKQMAKRCPGSRLLSKGYIKGWKFVYDGNSIRWNGAVANIIKATSESSEVWGGLFEINKDNLAALDCYEGYEQGAYDRGDNFEVFDSAGKPNKGIYSYYRTGKNKGTPSDRYKRIVLQGAKDCDLPKDYIENYL